MNSNTLQIAAIFQRVYEGNSLPSDWETYVRLISNKGGFAERTEFHFAVGNKKQTLQFYALETLKREEATEEMKRLAEMYLRDNPLIKK